MKVKEKLILVLTIFTAITLLFCLPQLCIAGSMEPTDSPGPTMHTLDEIYQKVSNVTRFPQCNGMRFLDLMDGTVADCETGLIWMRNANCFGLKPWANALNACNILADGSCGLVDDSVAGDWRLPSIRELEALVDKNYLSPALSNAAGNGHWVEGDAFKDVWPGTSWTASILANDTSYAWGVEIDDGSAWGHGKMYNANVWCVRGGQGVDSQ